VPHPPHEVPAPAPRSVTPRPVWALAPVILGLAGLLFAPVQGGPGAPATGAAAASEPTGAGGAATTAVTRVIHDGPRTVACADTTPDCDAWADALRDAERILDPVLPDHSALPTVLDVPTPAGQQALTGAGPVRPAATTLLITDTMVDDHLATPDALGQVRIVANPDVASADRVEVLVHELVHLRTDAPRWSGAIWVEEGYAVALTWRAMAAAGLSPRIVPDPGPGPEHGDGDGDRIGPEAAFPSGEWMPATTADYARAGLLVRRAVDAWGQDGVARWYAAVASGTSPAEAAPAGMTDGDTRGGH